MLTPDDIARIERGENEKIEMGGNWLSRPTIKLMVVPLNDLHALIRDWKEMYAKLNEEKSA